MERRPNYRIFDPVEDSGLSQAEIDKANREIEEAKLRMLKWWNEYWFGTPGEKK